MADDEDDKIQKGTATAAFRFGDEERNPLSRRPQAPFKKPTAVGCVFAQANPRIGDLPSEDYAALLEDL